MGIAGGQRNRSVGFLLMESWAGPGRVLGGRPNSLSSAMLDRTCRTVTKERI